mmetsp:Transcript_16397/g.46941  ORF Transcript_16397/g.46941 Transcript_16397/m.46941 type:complete len:290 (+) Transcript_16397:709-1578(+)
MAVLRPQHLGHDLLSFLPEGLQGKLVLADGVALGLHASVVHRVDLRNVLARNHLGQGPTKGAIGAGEVDRAVELVHLVQHDDELVVQARQGSGEDVQGLACGAGPVGVEQQQDQVSPLGEPTDHLDEVVAAAAGHVLGLHRHVDHARRVHDLQSVGHVGVRRQQQLLPPEVAPEGLAEALQLLEGPVLGATEQGGAVLDLVSLRVPLQDREAVVGRRNAGLLHLEAEQVVDERRLPGRMVADDDNHRREGEREQVVLKGPPWQSRIDRPHDCVLQPLNDARQLRLRVLH